MTTPKAIAVAPARRDNRVWLAFRRHKVALFGLVIVSILVTLAILAPLIAPYNPITPHYSETLRPPSAKYFLGTDEVGRDIFSRLLYGARISLVVGFVAQLVSLSIGIALGTLSGWYGGWIDDLVMRLADIFFAIPGLMFLIVWVTIFEPNPISIFLALGLISWPSSARMMRSQVLSIKNLEYITAARALGVPTRRILLVHILPNAIAPMIVLATLGIAGAVLSESILSYLGLGIQIPTPSWGTMIETGKGYITTAWWYAFYPGAVIFLTVLGFNFVGDGLRDALQPGHR
jgi:peptide/nickel transport system permease protein